MNTIAFYPVWAQQTTSNSTNMTSIMMDSTRLHLNTARNALMNGTTKAASDQITKAQMQLSMLHMKSMGTMNEMQALSFMRPGEQNHQHPKWFENCIILLSGELQCRDDLAQSYSFSSK